MLALSVDEFSLELKEGALKHVGASNKSATAKLYDVSGVEVREFGDERVKLVLTDDEGNRVEVALFPDEARELARRVDLLAEGSEVFE